MLCQSLQEVDQRKCETINSNESRKGKMETPAHATSAWGETRHSKRKRGRVWGGALNDQAFNDTRPAIDLPNTCSNWAKRETEQDAERGRENVHVESTQPQGQQSVNRRTKGHEAKCRG